MADTFKLKPNININKVGCIENEYGLTFFNNNITEDIIIYALKDYYDFIKRLPESNNLFKLIEIIRKLTIKKKTSN